MKPEKKHLRTLMGSGSKEKRTRSSIVEDSDSDSEKFFDISEHKIEDLHSLIVMIEDYNIKPLPPKRKRRSLPDKMHKLPNILDELYELNKLTGLNDLKMQIVDQILFFVQGVDESIMLHTVIEGPPGTGKTTVANIMARIYSKIGILKKEKFNIVRREDLVGQYLGETTIKTMETLNRCKHGVMFIDEAYSLGSAEGKGDSYAKEAVDAINQYLTENFDKIVCIIAGYKRELNECFFSHNPGLRRRFPWTFTIDNFGPKELTEIYFSMINDREWETDCTQDYVESIFTKNKQYFDGNGGDVHNLISKAMVVSIRKNFGKETLYTLTKEDFDDAMKQFMANKTSNINPPPFGMYN